MAISPDALTALAVDYVKAMTSIRGRRVQRLLRREFAGADHVLIVRTGPDGPAVLGVSPSGAAWCGTDGKGRNASVFKWLHGSSEALETHFDLLKDSLPVLETRWSKLAELPWRASALGALGSSAASRRLPRHDTICT